MHWEARRKLARDETEKGDTVWFKEHWQSKRKHQIITKQGTDLGYNHNNSNWTWSVNVKEQDKEDSAGESGRK